MNSHMNAGLADVMYDYSAGHRRARVRQALRRRWWVVLLFGILGGALALGVAHRTPSKYEAVAVVVVPATVPGQLPPGSPDGAIKLAQTYAELIPLDSDILAAAASKAGVSAASLGRNITVTNNSGSALLSITIVSDSAVSAVSQADAVASVITRPNPAGQVATGSLKAVSIPDSATVLTETTDATVAIGALLGLLVGLAVAAGIERSDRRVDDLADLAAVTGSSVSTWDRGTPEEAGALIHRWRTLANGVDPIVGFVGSASLGPAQVAKVSEAFAERAAAAGMPARSVTAGHISDAQLTPHRDDTGGARLVAAGRPGHGEGAELAAQTSDVVVLVAPRGGKAAEVQQALDALKQFGVRPVWALLASPARTAPVKKSAT